MIAIIPLVGQCSNVPNKIVKHLVSLVSTTMCMHTCVKFDLMSFVHPLCYILIYHDVLC